jgi:hypothetical protein|tara:strand:- start:205 stop:390 length:186 start_codon:yes stop_codon:yes gene_type:complete
MFEEYIIESDGFVTFYLINNRVTNKPELVAHFTSFKDVGEIKEFVKQFETEASITRPATIH